MCQGSPAATTSRFLQARQVSRARRCAHSTVARKLLACTSIPVFPYGPRELRGRRELREPTWRGHLAPLKLLNFIPGFILRTVTESRCSSIGEGGTMGRSSRIGPGWSSLTLAVLAFLWISLSGLLLVSWGNVEVSLHRTLGRYSRADTFGHLNGISVDFWLVQSALLLVGIAAAGARRSDVLTCS